MLATTLEADPYFGRIMSVKTLARDGRILERSRITRVLAVRGHEREALEEGCAGDIVALSGLSVTTVADTIVDPDNRRPLLLTFTAGSPDYPTAISSRGVLESTRVPCAP